MNYLAIDPYKSIEIEDAFCDENGNLNNKLPEEDILYQNPFLRCDG